MALWAGTAINTDELTTVFNRLFNRKLIDQVSDKKGLLEVIMGKPSPNPDKAGAKAFQRIRGIPTGKDIEVKLLGSYKSIGTIADGAAEVASTVGAVVEKYGAAVFAPTHYNDQHWIPASQYQRYKGDEAKTLNFIQDEYDWLIASFRETLAAGVSGTANQLRLSLGSWEYAVTNDNTYGTIDRSDAGNIDFRGLEKDTFGAFTLDKLQTEYTTLKAQEGYPDVMVAVGTVYNFVIRELRNEGTLIVNYGSDGRVGAGGSSFAWQGMDLILDPHTSAETLGLLESKSFVMYMDDDGMNPSAMVDTSKKAAMLINMNGWNAFICVIPKHNLKCNGVTT